MWLSQGMEIGGVGKATVGIRFRARSTNVNIVTTRSVAEAMCVGSDNGRGIGEDRGRQRENG